MMNLNDLQKLILRSRGIPTLSTVVTQLFEVLNDPDSSIDQASKIIKNDQTLVAKILRLINSAAYGLGRKITSLDESIRLLGFSTISNLSVSAAIMDSFQSKLIDTQAFWRHTIYTSIAAQYLANRVPKLEGAELASTLGLVHDIGKLFLLVEVPNEYEPVLKAEHSPFDVLNLEVQILGVDHCQTGLLLAKHWGWPSIYQDVLMFHHTPASSKINPMLNYCVYLANLVAHAADGEPIQWALVQEQLGPKSAFINVFSEQNWIGTLDDLARQQMQVDKLLQSIF